MKCNKNYKELLSFQPMLDADIINMIEGLQEGSITKEQLHNRKSYAKGKGSNLLKVLKCSIAFEIYQGLCDEGR